ncbi:hypothetical protein ACOMHN_046198 [Nucella lapillus]
MFSSFVGMTTDTKWIVHCMLQRRDTDTVRQAATPSCGGRNSKAGFGSGGPASELLCAYSSHRLHQWSHHAAVDAPRAPGLQAGWPQWPIHSSSWIRCYVEDMWGARDGA